MHISSEHADGILAKKSSERSGAEIDALDDDA